MVKRLRNCFVSLLLTFVTILTLIPAMTLPVMAADTPLNSLEDGKIGLSYSNASEYITWTAEGKEITGTAKAHQFGIWYDKESTLTITNNWKLDKNLNFALSFDYKIEKSKKSSVTINGSPLDPNQNKRSITLKPGATATVTIKASGSNGKVTITMTNVRLESTESRTATFQPAENGSYTVDENTITAVCTKTQNVTKAYQLKATPEAGYQFRGWYDETTGKRLNEQRECSLNVTADCTITAKFVPNDTARFDVDGPQFFDLREAVEYAAQTNKNKITLIKNGSLLAGEYTIPAGVTLLIPFDEAKTLYADEPDSMKEYVKPSLFRKLTMAPGSSITVDGSISVGGKHCHTMGSLGPSGPYGQIDMAAGSAIKLNNGANLYAWGFITGDGQITANSGAKVYEYFQVRDWRGGTATTDMLDNEQKVFPFSQYYVQNIEAALTIQAGAEEYTYTSIEVGYVISRSISFIGAQNCLFRLDNGATLTKKYDPSTDRMTYTTTGRASLDSLTLKINFLYTIKSEDYVLPVNSNMTLNILSGSVAVNSDTALLPGAQITIAQGAELNIASGKSLYVYDYNTETNEWGKYCYGDAEFSPVKYSPTKTKTRTLTDAKIDVNGTLTAAGSVYTTQSGADICSSEGTGRFKQQSAPGTSNETYQCTQKGSVITYVPIPVTAAKLKNANGSYRETAGSNANDTFTYCKCQDCGNGTWVKDVAAINDSTGKQVTTHNTLQKAVTDVKDNQYIKLLHNTTENPINVNNKSLRLDLNGRTVTGDILVTGDFKLYGMDSTAGENYVTAPKGKIVGTVKGCAPTYQTPGDTNDCYVAIQGTEADDKTANLSFHRFNISVTGYRFELATGDTPQCALFFIGKFQGDAEAKAHLSKLGFTLKGEDGRPLGTDSSPIPANPKEIPIMPADGVEIDSKVVRDADGAYLFEVYLKRSFEKDKPSGYTEKIIATAQAMFKNNGTQDSEPKKWSFEDAWTNPGELDTEQKDILDKFLKELGITKQAE